MNGQIAQAPAVLCGAVTHRRELPTLDACLLTSEVRAATVANAVLPRLRNGLTGPIERSGYQEDRLTFLPFANKPARLGLRLVSGIEGTEAIGRSIRNRERCPDGL